VAGFADELIGYGAGRSRIALVCANSLDLPIAMFAVHAAGAQAVPVNPAYTERELSYILRDADPVAIIYDADIAGKVDALIQATGIRHAVRIGGEAGRQLDVWRDQNQFAVAAIAQTRRFRNITIYRGHHGLPKGVNISHRQMSINISQREAALPTRLGDESILCMMPLFHVFAVAMCLHLSAFCAGKLVIVPRYRPDLVLDLIVSERITRLPAGPTVFIGLLAHEKFATTDFSSLRCAYSGLGTAGRGNAAAVESSHPAPRSLKASDRPRLDRC
jgi:long-chain acyl-CoA synthetase